MARYYRKRRTYRKKNKWNIEQRASSTSANAWQTISTANSFTRQVLVPIVPAISQEGVRKVKNISVSMAIQDDNSNASDNSIYWALIYAPEGTIINELKKDGELYQPSNFVINSGIFDSQNTSKYRISSRLARNLNANDRIYLLLGQDATSSDGPSRIAWLVRYAVCFN